MNTHFATSQRNDMRPLAFEGMLATDCHRQLQSFLAANQTFLAQHGLPDCQSFLAEPMYDPATGKTDWYTSAGEKPVPIAELPETEQQELLARTQQYLGALSALAKSCSTRHDMAASLLSLAMIHPGEQDIYSAGGNPVLINWGFEGSSAAQPEQIMRLGEQNKPMPVQQPEPEPVPEPEQPSGPQPVSAAGPGTEPGTGLGTGPGAGPVPGPEPGQNTSYAAGAAAPPTTVPPSAARSYTGCLPFLLPLLLALLLIWLLLAILGLMPSPLPASCFHQSVPVDNAPAGSGALEQGPLKQSLDSELARSRALAQKADNLIDRVRNHQAMCVPREAPKPAVPAPETPQPKAPLNEPEPPKAEPVIPQEQPDPPQAEPETPAIQPEEKPAEEPVPPKEEPAPLAQNEMPDFSTPVIIPEEEKKPEPKPKAKPRAQAQADKKAPEAKPEKKPSEKPKANRQHKGEAMQIPKDAAKNNDLSFLEGCWRSVTDLYNSSTGERVEMEYCFSADGSGRRTIRQRDGDICSGSASARFSGSRLNITAQEAYCRRGKFVPHKVQCNGTEQSTRCHGKEKKGAQGPSMGGGFLGQALGLIFGGGSSNHTWDATFIRK